MNEVARDTSEVYRPATPMPKSVIQRLPFAGSTVLRFDDSIFFYQELRDAPNGTSATVKGSSRVLVKQRPSDSIDDGLTPLRVGDHYKYPSDWDASAIADLEDAMFISTLFSRGVTIGSRFSVAVASWIAQFIPHSWMVPSHPLLPGSTLLAYVAFLDIQLLQKYLSLTLEVIMVY
jgi:hypothetical protein